MNQASKELTSPQPRESLLVVIPTYRRKASFKESLLSVIAAKRYAEAHANVSVSILVIDNGNTEDPYVDATIEGFRSLCCDLLVARFPENSFGNIRMVMESVSSCQWWDYLVEFSDDDVMGPCHLYETVSALRGDSHAAFCSTATIPYSGYIGCGLRSAADQPPVSLPEDCPRKLHWWDFVDTQPVVMSSVVWRMKCYRHATQHVIDPPAPGEWYRYLSVLSHPSSIHRYAIQLKTQSVYIRTGDDTHTQECLKNLSLLRSHFNVWEKHRSYKGDFNLRLHIVLSQAGNRAGEFLERLKELHPEEPVWR